MKQFAKPEPGEKELALYAVDMVQRYGGVLEHPVCSELWAAKALPMPGERDNFGGFSICIDQFWFGHRAQKKTLLYIVGVKPSKLPEIPLNFEEPAFLVGKRPRGYWKKQISKREREATPEPLARWLVNVASLAIPGAINPGTLKHNR